MARTQTQKRGGISRAFFISALIAAMLWGCAPNEAGRQKAPDFKRVIVKFRLPERAGKGAAREAAARILSRLKPQVRKTARTFELLPLIAVEADAETLMRLIRMAEVESIQPDHEVRPLGSPGTMAR